jgi:hypothetical protein
VEALNAELVTDHFILWERSIPEVLRSDLFLFASAAISASAKASSKILVLNSLKEMNGKLRRFSKNQVNKNFMSSKNDDSENS